MRDSAFFSFFFFNKTINLVSTICLYFYILLNIYHYRIYLYIEYVLWQNNFINTEC